jgi:hypothetical protein
LKLQILTDSIDLDVEEVVDKVKKKSRKPRKKSAGRNQFIDGRKLTQKEIDFEEFNNARFSSEEWLRKNGLIL